MERPISPSIGELIAFLNNDAVSFHALIEPAQDAVRQALAAGGKIGGFSAQVLQFSSEQVVKHTLHQHLHFTRQHASGVRSEHEFFGEVCDALQVYQEVLVTGAHKAQADFRHYVEKHRAHLAPKIVGWETVDHPTDGQLAALAKNGDDSRRSASIGASAGRRSG